MEGTDWTDFSSPARSWYPQEPYQPWRGYLQSEPAHYTSSLTQHDSNIHQPERPNVPSPPPDIITPTYPPSTLPNLHPILQNGPAFPFTLPLPTDLFSLQSDDSSFSSYSQGPAHSFSPLPPSPQIGPPPSRHPETNTSSTYAHPSPSSFHFPQYEIPITQHTEEPISPFIELTDEEAGGAVYPFTIPIPTVLPPHQSDENTLPPPREQSTPSPRLPSIASLSSRNYTPITRPISQLSWSSGGTSIFGSPPSSWPTPQDQNRFVDLTADLSPPMMPASSVKRKASQPRTLKTSSAAPSNPAKRNKTGAGPSTELSPAKDEHGNIEEVDLRDVNDDKGLMKLLDQQRVDSIKAQKEQADKPLKISTLQCIICMEPMTNITVTHCGKPQQRVQVQT